MNWTDPTFLVTMAGLTVGLVLAIVAAVRAKSVKPVIQDIENDVPVIIEAVVADETKANATSTK